MKIRKNYGKNVRLDMYVDYCTSLLVGLKQVKIQAAQNAAARVVTRSRRLDHITPLLTDHHWLPLQQRCEHKLLSPAHKALNGQAPEYMAELFEVYTPRSLRSNSQIRLGVPGPRAGKTQKYGQRSLRYIGPTLYNSVPELLKKSKVEVFLDRITPDALADHEGTVIIGGGAISNLRFADAIDGLAAEKQDFELLVQRLDTTSRAFEMEITAEKIKMMTNNTNGINIDLKVQAKFSTQCIA